MAAGAFAFAVGAFAFTEAFDFGAGAFALTFAGAIFAAGLEAFADEAFGFCCAAFFGCDLGIKFGCSGEKGRDRYGLRRCGARGKSETFPTVPYPHRSATSVKTGRQKLRGASCAMTEGSALLLASRFSGAVVCAGLRPWCGRSRISASALALAGLRRGCPIR